MTRHGDRYDGDEAWLADLRAWHAPRVSAGVEERLRQSFRGRRRQATVRLWLGRAAMLLLALGVALLARFGQRGDERAAVSEALSTERFVAVAVTVTRDGVRTELDMSGFEPVRRTHVKRVAHSVVETDLEGFLPVRKTKVTRWKGGW